MVYQRRRWQTETAWCILMMNKSSVAVNNIYAVESYLSWTHVSANNSCCFNATFCVWKQTICKKYAPEYLPDGHLRAERSRTCQVGDASKNW
jgi:hypothetical protein